VELVNRIPSGQTFHRYLNLSRLPAEAFAVHGLSVEFLKDKPLFGEIVDDLVAFIADAPLVAHNAMFDLGFLNAELDRVGKMLVARERLVDTLLLARRKHPGGPNGLDHLCGRYGIDNSRRTKHGALLDAEILAEVYVELIGARQAQLILVEAGGAAAGMEAGAAPIRLRPQPLAPRLAADEREAHLRCNAGRARSGGSSRARQSGWSRAANQLCRVAGCGAPRRRAGRADEIDGIEQRAGTPVTHSSRDDLSGQTSNSRGHSS
jgi:DNA polymerase-3 subunit epsilon